MIVSTLQMAGISRIGLVFLLHALLLPVVSGFSPVKSSNSRLRSLWSWRDQSDQDVLPRHLIDSLDLDQIIVEVARHTATRRGYSALLSIIQQEPTKLLNNPRTLEYSNRRRILDGGSRYAKKSRVSLLAPIAKSAEDVRSEYTLVEEAALLLSENNSTSKSGNGYCCNLTYPPLYGEQSGPFDIKTIPQTDDDEWLYLRPDQFTAENVLQAEQVMKKLLQIRTWSQQKMIQAWAPSLARIASKIDEEEEKALSTIYRDIAGNIEIVRVKSLASPLGKSSYTIRVKEHRFPVLQLLNQKELKLLKNGAKELDNDLVVIRAEIEETTQQILYSLALKILSVSESLDQGMEIMARLDVLVAKAAFSITRNGVAPIVKTSGEISIENFLHPALLITMGDIDRVVPIDLRLSSDTGESALVISGPNGGGKTLSMKSFGVVSILTKLAIPIPVKDGDKRPRVDYFDQIFVNVGDQQSLLDGESTWTSILNTCASMIQRITQQREDGTSPSYLVLLDELGTGTDPESGGAVAQAVLEELIANSCKVVVTTHLPRLKTISYNDVHIGCAAVLLDYSDSSTFKRPSFKLEYGLIGESHALSAASRCVPSLPDHVLSRAFDLMNDAKITEENTNNKNYLEALTNSMEEQLERSKIATLSASRCREAMVSLARAYECHLDRKLNYLESSVKYLKESGASDYEVVGKTLSELKVIKKRIITQEEKLALKGLKVLPANYKLYPGESVVIIVNGELEGMTATVLAEGPNRHASLDPNQVLVKPSLSFHVGDDAVLTSIDPMKDKTLVLQRQELAIWDFDSIDDTTSQSKAATSITNSKQKLSSLLSKIDSVSSNERNGKKSQKKKQRATSSRERKAARKAKKKKGR